MATVKVNKALLSSVIRDLNEVKDDLSLALTDCISSVPSKVDLSKPPFKNYIYRQWDEDAGEYVDLDTPIIKYRYREQGRNFNSAIDAINPQLESISGGLQYLDNVIGALNEIENAVAAFEELDYSGDLADYNFNFTGANLQGDGVIQAPIVALKLAATAIAEANGWLDTPEDSVEGGSAFANLQDYLMELGLIEEEEKDLSLVEMINAMGVLIKEYTSSDTVTEVDEEKEKEGFLSSLADWFNEKNFGDLLKKIENDEEDEQIILGVGEAEISSGALMGLVCLNFPKLAENVVEKPEEETDTVLSEFAGLGATIGAATFQYANGTQIPKDDSSSNVMEEKNDNNTNNANSTEKKEVKTPSNTNNDNIQNKPVNKEESGPSVVHEQEPIIEDTKPEIQVEEKEVENTTEDVVEEIKIEVSQTADRLNSALQHEETVDSDVDLPKIKNEPIASATANDTVSSLIENIGEEKVTTSAVAGIVGVGSVLGNNNVTPTVTTNSSTMSVGPVTYSEGNTAEVVASNATYSNTNTADTVSKSEDSGLGKGKSTYGTSVKTTQNKETENMAESTPQSGMLGEASYVEMLAKEEKKYKIATATSLSATLLTLGLKYIGVIGWLSLLLLIIAIILVYTTYRARHKKKKKKLEALIRIEKEKSLFEREKEKKQAMTLEEAANTEIASDSSEGEEIKENREEENSDAKAQVEEDCEQENGLKVPVLPEQKEFQMAEEIIYGEMPKRTEENEITETSEEIEEKE